MDDAKNILLSKTLWLNILGPVFAYLAARGINVSPDAQVQIVLGLMSIANIIMRRFTSTPVVILPAKK